MTDKAILSCLNKLQIDSAFYFELEVEKRESYLKKQYRQLSKLVHPDNNINSDHKEELNNRFNELTHAFQTLKQNLGYQLHKKPTELKDDDILRMFNERAEERKQEQYEAERQRRKDARDNRRKKEATVRIVLVGLGVVVVVVSAIVVISAIKCFSNKGSTRSTRIEDGFDIDDFPHDYDHDDDQDYEQIPTIQLNRVVPIKQDDTLSDFALEYGVSVEDLMSVNGLSSTKILAGDFLKIPYAISRGELNKHCFTVVSDKNLSELADLYHTDVETLKTLNPLWQHGNLYSVPDFSAFEDDYKTHK